MPRCAAEVCHAHQLNIWSGEIAERIEPHLKDMSYGDLVDLRLGIEDELKRIVGTAFELSDFDK